MKKNFYYFLFLATYLLLNCSKIKKTYTITEIKGAWTLYAFNYAQGDSLLFKKKFPDKNYSDFLSMEAVPLKTDTLPDNSIHISYIWKDDKEYFPFTFLTFHGVDFDLNNNVIKVHADDGSVLEINKEVNDKNLVNFIANNRKHGFSDMLLQGYKLKIGKD